MLKIIVTILVSALVGVGLGRVQSSIVNSAFEERFGGTRLTEAELQGEVTNDQMTTGTPKADVVGGTEFQFGMMRHGDTMSHIFPIRNVGDGPLTLEMGESSCKCTVGDLESTVLQPGEETEVKLTWTAESLMREFGQSAVIITNVPNETEIKLTIRGQIADSFVMEPRALSLGSISVKDSVSRTFHVFTYLKRSKELSDFKWSDPETASLVTIESEKIEFDKEIFPEHKNASGVHKVTVDIRPGSPLGPLGARIQFLTDQGDDVGLLQVPVTGTITGEMVLFGGSSFDPRNNTVTLGNVQSSKGAKVTVWLTIHGGDGADDGIVPKVESIEPTEALEVTIGEPKRNKKGKMYTLHFEVPKGAPEVYYPGTSSTSLGKVVIKTNHKVPQELPINVRLIVTK